MDATTKDDLRVALRLIRDTGQKVRDQGWESGPSMEESVEAAAPMLARSYELPGEIAWVREQLNTDFVSWRELLRLIRDEPTNADLKETARFLSGHMVDRADALLAWLQEKG